MWMSGIPEVMKTFQLIDLRLQLDKPWKKGERSPESSDK